MDSIVRTNGCREGNSKKLPGEELSSEEAVGVGTPPELEEGAYNFGARTDSIFRTDGHEGPIKEGFSLEGAKRGTRRGGCGGGKHGGDVNCNPESGSELDSVMGFPQIFC